VYIEMNSTSSERDPMTTFLNLQAGLPESREFNYQFLLMIE
jgi:hypothetical protein